MALEPVGTRLVAQDADKYVRDVERASQSTDQFGKTLKGLGVITAGLAIGRAITGMAQSALGAVASYEQLSMSMSSLVAKELRTADATLSIEQAMEQASGRAEELLGWIQDLAIKSPFSQEGVAMAFRTALAYGFTSEEAQTLTAATIDFATATGQSVGVMNQVALALGQIKAKGKLAGQEILQLVSAGFSVNPVLEKMGYTMEDVSKGLVPANAFLAEFTKTLQEDFGGAATRSAETVNGLLDSLGDLQQVGLRELFGPAIQATLPLLNQMVGKLQEIMPVISMVGQGLGRMVTFLIDNKRAIGEATVAFGIFFAVLNAGTILSAVPLIIGKITASLGVLTGALAVIASPLGILATAAGLLTFGLLKLRGAMAETGDGTQQAAAAVGSGTHAINQHVGQLRENAENSYGWGYNLIMNFAEGMAAAISAVLQVLTNLATQIAYWLAPGSPPRLLPDIDKWGSEAMQEYVGGFGKVDFGLFRDISSQIEGYLRSTGEVDEGMLGNIIGSRSAVMEALSIFRETGSVTEEAFQGIFDAAGIADGALQDYVRAAFAAAAASEQVQQAQEALNAVSEQYAAILDPLHAELNAISDARQAYVDEQRKVELEAIIADENAPAIAKELAMMELREMAIREQIRATEQQQAADEAAAQANLDAAVDAEQAAMTELETQQALIDLQIQNNQLLQEQATIAADALGAIGGAAGGAAGGVGALAGQMGGIPSLADSIGGAADGLKTKFTEMLDGLKAPFEGLRGQFEETKKAWAGAMLAFLARFEPVGAALREAWGPGGTWAGIMDNLGTTAELLGDRWDSVWGEGGIWRVMLQKAGEWFGAQWGEGGTWAGIMDNLGTTAELLGDRWDSVWGEGGIWRTMLETAGRYITDQWGEGGVWAGILDNLKTALTTLKTQAVDALKQGFEALISPISTVVGWIDTLVQAIANVDLSALASFLPGSPPPLAVGFAEVERAAAHFTATALPRLQRGMALSLPATSGQVAAQAVSYQTTNQFNMGGNTVSNGMDMAMFEAAVLGVVNRALG